MVVSVADIRLELWYRMMSRCCVRLVLNIVERSEIWRPRLSSDTVIVEMRNIQQPQAGDGRFEQFQNVPVRYPRNSVPRNLLAGGAPRKKLLHLTSHEESFVSPQKDDLPFPCHSPQSHVPRTSFLPKRHAGGQGSRAERIEGTKNASVRS